MRLVQILCAALLAPVVVGGCQGSAPQPGASGTASSVQPPRLGGPQLRPAPTPHKPMSRLERPIASRLARKAAEEGLTLGYLSCPRWDGGMPKRLRCTGWFDGVKAPVLVQISTVVGGSVTFDARIGHGVVATQNLVGLLRGRGYTGVDCGHQAAYPSRAGLRLVCAVHRHGTRSYVVAVVRDATGAVAIHDY